MSTSTIIAYGRHVPIHQRAVYDALIGSGAPRFLAYLAILPAGEYEISVDLDLPLDAKTAPVVVKGRDGERSAYLRYATYSTTEERAAGFSTVYHHWYMAGDVLWYSATLDDSPPSQEDALDAKRFDLSSIEQDAGVVADICDLSGLPYEDRNCHSPLDPPLWAKPELADG
tara:strand:- start:4838 stop:5350 length:513 start_codon:yes stop_codon:yes gene_type:complete